MDEIDSRLVDLLQRGLPITERPFEEVATRLGLTQQAVAGRLSRFLADGLLSRFGPLFNADAWGGGYLLCAMAVPEANFEGVAAAVNAYPEVAHNYRREHRLNMWFVVATERQDQLRGVVEAIENDTGLSVLELPKEEEFFVGLHLVPERA